MLQGDLITTTSGSTYWSITTDNTAITNTYPIFYDGTKVWPITTPTPPVTLTDDQFATLVEKLTLVLSNGWACHRCNAVWAPTIEFCRVCSLQDRVEEEQVA